MLVSLEDRVARLERSARRWKIVAFVAVVGLAGLGAADAVSVPDEIKAKSFVLIGKETGRESGRLASGKTKDGFDIGMLALQTTEEKPSIITAIQPGKDNLHFFDGRIGYVEKVYAKNFVIPGSGDDDEVLGVFGVDKDDDGVEHAHLIVRSKNGSMGAALPGSVYKWHPPTK